MTPEEAAALAKAEAEAKVSALPKVDAFSDTDVDMGKSFGSRFAEGISSIPAMLPGANLVKMGADAAGLPQEMYDPQALLEKVAPGTTTYKSKTTPGKYAGAVGTAASGLVMGPGNLGRKAVMSLAAGTVSEGAGQIAEGNVIPGVSAPAWAPAARVAGMIFGGLAGAGKPDFNAFLTAAKKVVKQRAITPEALQATVSKMYKAFEDRGIVYDSYSFQGLGQRIHKTLYSSTRGSHRPSSSKAAFDIADDLTRDAAGGMSPNFTDLEELSKRIGGQIRTARKAGDGTLAHALKVVRDELDDFQINAPLISKGGSASPKDIKAARDLMRGTARRAIAARRMDEMFEDADAHAGGFNTGLKAEINTSLKDPRDKLLFTENERNLQKGVRDGRLPFTVFSVFGGTKLPTMSQQSSSIASHTALPAGMAIAMGSPASLPILAAGAAGVAMKAKGSLKPILAAKRMETAANAMRHPEFDRAVTEELSKQNRRILQQYRTGLPASLAAKREMEKK